MASIQQNHGLQMLSPSGDHHFVEPIRRIHDENDVSFFKRSKAYAAIMTFLLQLNRAMFPVRGNSKTDGQPSSGGDEIFDPGILSLRALLSQLTTIVDEAPPDTGPRRFGNVSFRRWYEIVESRTDKLLLDHIPRSSLRAIGRDDSTSDPYKELRAYLLGSFGSQQRLDYGTGHELSFFAFVASIWKLGGFSTGEGREPGLLERQIVMAVFVPYFSFVRRLIKTYTLEPAGSHGVWGLDDHSFLPYIFGSAQLSPAISTVDPIPTEGSSTLAPDPGDVVKPTTVERERNRNLYFGAIGFIYDVKKGPFWEHSPVLFDVSGVKAGWAKINKGMIKMYDAEVLSKFPVVQHFPFGSLFEWERDPMAPASTQAQPLTQTRMPLAHAPKATQAPRIVRPSNLNPPASKPDGAAAFVGTAAPWAQNIQVQDPGNSLDRNDSSASGS